MNTIAVLGAGTMGSALIAGVLKSGVADQHHLVATVRTPEHAAAAGERFGIRVSAGANREAAQSADLIVLAVKPVVVTAVLDEIRNALRPGQILISLAASLPLSVIEARIGIPMPVFRVVTNLPIQVRAGASAITSGATCKPGDREIVDSLFRAVGVTAFVDEDRLHAANALAGCGPAYVYMVIEAMIAGGVKMGLPRDVATRLAGQTVLGAAGLARESGLHPAVLSDQVITPGGATMTAVHELEKQGLRAMFISAIEIAARHSEERMRKLLAAVEK
jgi:pyrroline-5-carboxylate reductase